ncbi:hypothetical protein ADL22_06715 [Streptomyces sp. NRRL F-4489]|nr:hypothetical protein ADL22_06715 [Streptomyces sp. NRRL F-4489]
MDQWAGFEAGRHKRLTAANRASAPLPVPRHWEDRQAELRDTHAAQRIATDVTSLLSQQKLHEAAALLQNALAVSTPAEMTALVVVLRGREVGAMTDTLLQACGRDLQAPAVIGLAHGLLQKRLAADAEKVLRAASGRMQDSPAG